MITTADYAEKIPNNVDLREDRGLQRALEPRQPNFLHWRQTMGLTLGREDREEAEELLHRSPGSVESPRILGAFNEETPDWLAF